MNPYYTDYSEYLNRFFQGEKIQKISINTGGSCPNRDGTLGTGGCIYCNNISFTPSYCFGDLSVQRQYERGKEFFKRKYPRMRYLPYFQSYTSTYGTSTEKLFEAARLLACDSETAGVVIGTRPDCIDNLIMEEIAELNRRTTVFVELGVESLHDRTLHVINRGHTADCSLECIRKLCEAGIHTGAHLIAGLPGEGNRDILKTIELICATGVESLKLHHLQILKGTAIERMLQSGELEVKPMAYEDYLDLCCRIVGMVPRRICIERFVAQSPPEMVIAPKWNIKNHEFTAQLMKRLSLQAIERL